MLFVRLLFSNLYMKAINSYNMLKGSNGRPQKQNNVVKVSELIVEYLTTKPNNYSKNSMYFKITDSYFRAKFKPLFSLNDGDLEILIWETENKELILKVGDQWYAGICELMNGETYVLDLEFQSYQLETNDGNNIKGYYCKIPNAKPLQVKFDVIPQSEDN